MRDVRAEFRRRDWFAGIPDFALALGLLVLVVGCEVDFSWATLAMSYMDYSFGYDLLAAFTLPSLIWIFEKRGAEDPRPVDVTRKWRVGLTLFFAAAGFNLSVVVDILAHVGPFLLARAAHFLFDRSGYGDFTKAGRRLAFASLFVIFGGLVYVFAWPILSLDKTSFYENYGVVLFSVLYFVYFGFVETLARPMRRMPGLDKEDKKYAE